MARRRTIGLGRYCQIVGTGIEHEQVNGILIALIVGIRERELPERLISVGSLESVYLEYGATVPPIVLGAYICQ
jgi:hypothetical protein